MTDIIGPIVSGISAAVATAFLFSIIGEGILHFPSRILTRLLRSLTRVNLLKYAQCALKIEEYSASLILTSAALDEALRRKLPKDKRHERILFTVLFQKAAETYHFNSKDTSVLLEILAKREWPSETDTRLKKEEATQALRCTEKFLPEIQKSRSMLSPI